MYLLSSKGSRLLILSSTILFLSCSTHSTKEQSIIKVFGENCNNNNRALSYNNETVYDQLKAKLSDQSSYRRAEIWEPKALLALNYTNETNTYLEQLKNELLKKSGKNAQSGEINQENEGAVNDFFEKEGKGKEIYNRLFDYRDKLLNIDSLIREQFGNDSTFLPQSKQYYTYPQSFTEFFFHYATPVTAITILTQFQNVINVMGNRVLTFCNAQTSSIRDGGYYVYSVIVGQSSSVVRAGENIEITAGVGSFSKAALPKITINKDSASIGEEGCAIYKVKASTQAGKHVIPVRIEYTDQDGKKQIIDKEVEYTVEGN